MYHGNNPSVVEIPDDIESIESAQYSNADPLLFTVTFKLKPGKQYNPLFLFATNGVDSRMFPLILVDPTPAPEPTMPEAQEEVVAEVKVVEDAPKKSRGKRIVDSEE